MNAIQVKEDFRSVRSIWKFIGLAILSGGFYPFHWIMRFLEVLNDKYNVSKEVTKTPLYILWVSIVITYLLLPIAEVISYAALLSGDDSSTATGLATISWIFSIIFSLLAKKILENVFAKNNIKRELSTLWTVIFTYFYFYYVLSKLEDKIAD